MKEVCRNDDKVAYSGFKDAYGRNILVVIDETLRELRLYGKDKTYNSRRYNASNNPRYKHVVIHPEYLEVIDIAVATKKKIEKLFPNYKHTEWQIWKEVI